MRKWRFESFIIDSTANAEFGPVCQPNGPQIVKISVNIYSAAAPYKDVNHSNASVNGKGP